jgi:uncharacterized protein YggT (Ycf19 family)
MSQHDVQSTAGVIIRALLWLVYAWVVVNLVLLFLAFLLLLLGANPDAAFAEWIYRSVQRSMAPFHGLFEPIQLTGESVLDTSLLFAMIVYGFVALFLKEAIDWLTSRIARRRLHMQQQQEQEPLTATAPPVA